MFLTTVFALLARIWQNTWHESNPSATNKKRVKLNTEVYPVDA